MKTMYNRDMRNLFMLIVVTQMLLFQPGIEKSAYGKDKHQKNSEVQISDEERKEIKKQIKRKIIDSSSSDKNSLKILDQILALSRKEEKSDAILADEKLKQLLSIRHDEHMSNRIIIEELFSNINLNKNEERLYFRTFLDFAFSSIVDDGWYHYYDILLKNAPKVYNDSIFDQNLELLKKQFVKNVFLFHPLLQNINSDLNKNINFFWIWQMKNQRVERLNHRVSSLLRNNGDQEEIKKLEKKMKKISESDFTKKGLKISKDFFQHFENVIKTFKERSEEKRYQKYYKKRFKDVKKQSKKVERFLKEKIEKDS